MPAGDVKVEIDFGPPGGAASWTDITTARNVRRVRQISIKRGRQRETDRMAPGRATVILDNRDRTFDPTYTSAGAPYNGNILPTRRIRIQLHDGAAYEPVFVGYIDSWTQDYEPPRDATVIIQATDGFKVLAAAKLPDSAYAVEVRNDTPIAWWRFGEAADTSVATEQIGHYNGTVAGTPTFGVAGLVINSSDTAYSSPASPDSGGVVVEDTTPSIVVPFAGASYTIEMLLMLHSTPFTRRTIFDQRTSEDSEMRLQVGTAQDLEWVRLNHGTGSEVQVISTETLAAETLYHVVLVSRGKFVAREIWINGVEGATGSDTSGTEQRAGAISFTYSPANGYVGADVTLDEFSIYNTDLSSDRIAEHYAAVLTPWEGDLPGERIERVLDSINFSATDRDIDTGSTVLGIADLRTDAASYLRAVADSEQGQVFFTREGILKFRGRHEGMTESTYLDVQATFGDSSAELPYFDIQFDYSDLLIYNEIHVSRNGGSDQQSSDEASKTAYLERGLSLTGLLHASDVDSQLIADYILSRYKDPDLRVASLTVTPNRSPATLFPIVAGTELLQRFRILRRPQAVGPAIDQEATIQGITHTWNATDDAWTTTYDVSPIDAVRYWLAGVAGQGEAGVTTRAGY